MLVHELNQRLFDYFEYVPRSTRVDSPIDDAIVSGKGVCQDFAHTMIALLRHVRIPARYVSGYLYRSREDHDRSTPDATHAWVDVLLPHLGWVGFDPTNNLIAHHRHIRTAVGRDYADVPPTHGIFRGKTDSELYVAVHVEAGTHRSTANAAATIGSMVALLLSPEGFSGLKFNFLLNLE
jgi:transglutaminase-like putative cysteine protease